MKSGIFITLCILISACSDGEGSHLILPDPTDIANQEHTDWCVKHNLWTYNQMAHDYFWYTEMPDSASLDFTREPPAFFESIKSPEDRFSWCEANHNFTGTIQRIVDAGFEYQPYIDRIGQTIYRILYVTSNQLREEGFQRGDWVHITSESASTLCLEKGEIINQIFISKSKFVHSRTSPRNTNLAPSIPLDSIYRIDHLRIGYLIYNQFESSSDLIQLAIKFKKEGIDDLILDLRYNPGGYVATAGYLASVVIPQEALGKVYQKQRYNDKITKDIIRQEGGNGERIEYFQEGSIIASRNLNLPRVVILTTENTASASESTIIGLRPYMQVITIGTTTYGKDVGSYTIADNRYKYQLQPITFRYYNALNDSTPQTGILPTIRVNDDLNHARGDIREAMLKTALEYLSGTLTEKSQLIDETAETDYPIKYGPSSIRMNHYDRY